MYSICIVYMALENTLNKDHNNAFWKENCVATLADKTTSVK